jgi:acylphosphatase
MVEETGHPGKRLHVRLDGRVQGVGFRAFVQQTAASIGLHGWVRNRWDGSVEVLAEGPEPELDRLLSALRRGPHTAIVSDVSTDWQNATGEFSSFSVRRTE